jgi:hypothetical protein
MVCGQKTGLFLPTFEFYCTRNLVRYWLLDLDAFSGPEYGSVDDLKDFGLVIGWVGFMSGAEVHDSTDSLAVVDSVAWARGEFRVYSVADGPDHAAWECLVSDAEVGLVDDGERSGDLERSAVHFFCGDDEVTDSVGDGVPWVTDSNGFNIV